MHIYYIKIIKMENNQYKIKCDMCNTFYSKNIWYVIYNHLNILKTNMNITLKNTLKHNLQDSESEDDENLKKSN